MSGAFPVDDRTNKIFLRSVQHAKDLGAEMWTRFRTSLRLIADARCIHLSALPNFVCRDIREHSRASISTDHWRTVVPDRSHSGRARSLACVHRPTPWRADGVDALLRTDAGRSSAAAQQLADARARTCFKTRRIRLEFTLPSTDALKRLLSAAAALLLASVMLHAEARDFDRQLRLQAATDRAWRDASDGYMRMEKI